MSIEDVRAKLRQYRHLPIREVHMVAGINPKLPYQYYVDLVRAVKEERPERHVKAFTMVELVEIARVGKKSVAEVLADLKEAGLGSLPGGGAEVFSDRVRQEIFPLKIGRREWQEIARTAHGMGLKSNATMLYGHLETVEEKVDHLIQLRELQDETGGFMTFIPLAFHPLNTEMDDLPMTTGSEDLRHLALGRLLLDNFPHVKAFWIMISPPVSQVSLWYGADDVDGTIVEEKITHAAGARTVMELTQSELIAMILEAGRIPVERDTVYNVMESWDAGRQAMIPALT
jgi:aminodeoxyfutalosine synthase